MSGIRRVIEEIVKDTVVMAVQSGTVTAINGETCTVKSDHDDAEYFEVAFNALGINKDNKLLLTPKLDTKVIFGVLPNATDAILISFSEVDQLHYTTETTVFEIDKDGYRVESMGQDLKTVLNDYIDEVNKIVVINGTTINVAATTAIKERLNQILK